MKLIIEPTEKFKELDLELPKMQTKGAAGIDLYACIDEPVVLNSQFKFNLSEVDRFLNQTSDRPSILYWENIPTGIKVQIPDGYYGKVVVRSSLGFKYRVTMGNSCGVIDSDYRGEIKVPLINHGHVPYTINPGDRICQLIIVPYLNVETELGVVDDTDRGEGGFGSTGK